jgi:hypothetical protein
MNWKSSILLSLATLAGLAIAWIDAQPTWDDTGITVLIVLTVAALFGFFTSKKIWITALAVSIWIPIVSIGTTHNFGGLLALIPGFVGAYFGYFIKMATKG